MTELLQKIYRSDLAVELCSRADCSRKKSTSRRAMISPVSLRGTVFCRADKILIATLHLVFRLQKKAPRCQGALNIGRSVW
jgi:hypothetical protein